MRTYTSISGEHNRELSFCCVVPFVAWSLWGHRDWVVLVHTSVFWGWYGAFGVTDVLQQEYGYTKASRRHTVPEDLHVLMMYYTLGAKQRKQRRLFVAQYRCYTYLRGRWKYGREKRRLPTTLNCLCSSLYYMAYLRVVRRSSYVVGTQMFDIKREAKKKDKKYKKQDKKWPLLLYILSLAI